MDKLQFNHIAPYLPFDLTFYEEFEAVNEVKEKVLVKNLYLLKTEATKMNHINIEMALDFEQYKTKPVFRPTSDLTKEVNHKGSRFVPFMEIEREFSSDYNDFKFKTNPFRISFSNNSIGTHQFIQYSIFQKLLEWHFDIFELIDLGLAVDINKIKL